jgi:putative flippase GtrA
MQTTRETPGEGGAMTGQLVRFVMTGGFVTALGIGVYALVAIGLGWNPQLGNFLAYAVAVATGYVLHSRWSFRGHGGERTNATRLRFAAVSVISYALNSLWVWLFYTYLDLGRAVPMIPMLFVTPVVTVVLNRQWVFR